MVTVKTWFAQKENRLLVCKIVAALCFPLLLCIIYCLREGIWIGNISPAGSMNNDALFYYKQVEGMVESGIPVGFFGFNESHALKGSFAAWIPVVLLPWAIWGKIFGWSLASPILCNIILFSVVLGLLVWWIRPTVKQMLVTGAMMALFPGFSRYLMACLAEAQIFTGFLLMYSLALGYIRKPGKGKLITMFVLAGILSWIRPYMLLLVFLPGFFLFRQKKVPGVLVTLLVTAADAAIYFLMGHYWTAAYFTDLYDVSALKLFLTEGIGAGLSNLTAQAGYFVRTLLSYMKNSVTTGMFMGSNYWILFLLFILLLPAVWRLWKEKEGLQLFVYIHFLFTAACSTAALLILMQKINEGSRHIMSFILVGMLLLGLSSEIRLKDLWRAAIVALMCIYLYHFFPDDGQDYQVPVYTGEAREEQVAWEEINSRIEIDLSGDPSYDNTLIWVFSDKIGEEVVYMPWHHMLSVPGGMGISCCTDSYLMDNWDNLQSRYITTLSDGEIAKWCEKSGFEKIGEATGKVLYKRY